MAVCDAYMFPGFLTPVLTQLFFPKPLTIFLTCFFRGERRKYAGNKSHLNRGSNSQPPGHELTTEPPGRGKPFPKQALVFTCLQNKSFENTVGKGEITHNEQFLLFPVLSTLLENFQTFTSLSKSMGECNTILSACTKYRPLGKCCTHPSKSSSANSFSLEESKICHLGKG